MPLSSLRLGRIAVAILMAEVVPIVLLVVVVFVYAMFRDAQSPSPEEFAPRAGNWVGPIGGFFATLLFSWWAARSTPNPLAHGMLVGLGTAVLDLALALMMGWDGSLQPLLLLSNGGRVLAGALGGWLASSRAVQPAA